VVCSLLALQPPPGGAAGGEGYAPRSVDGCGETECCLQVVHSPSKHTHPRTPLLVAPCHTLFSFPHLLTLTVHAGALQAASAAAEARALGRRQPHQLPALQGVLELGGASAQVAYPLPLSAPALQDPGAELALPGPGGVQRLAVASWDGLGLQAAREAWAGHLTGSGERRDPCLPHGWDGTRGLTGSADWRACREGVAALLRRGQLSCTAATGCRSTAATSARALPRPQGAHACEGCASSSSSSSAAAAAAAAAANLGPPCTVTTLLTCLLLALV
jgi:hypothetical protein